MYMTNISGMDYNNTPFDIPAKTIKGKDEPTIITPSYLSANRRNIEQVIRQINQSGKSAEKDLNKFVEEINIFKEIWEMSDDTETVVISVEKLKEILVLAENIKLSFTNLLSAVQ
jgi:hypothetical protein